MSKKGPGRYWDRGNKPIFADFFYKRIKKIGHFPVKNLANLFTSDNVLKAQGINVCNFKKGMVKSTSQTNFHDNTSRTEIFSTENESPMEPIIIKRIKGQSKELASRYLTQKESGFTKNVQAKPIISILPPLIIHNAAKIMKRSHTPV